MQKYNNSGKTKGINAYESGFDFIRVRFDDGAQYLYTYSSTGSKHIEKMKILASRGDGLDRYINQHVADRYESKEK
ncbi:MAG: hypothetical protein HUJ29_03105 [Gammaproteobacteria bacterium]|nr:hypothetical protein [Gammaproteobacteria bacterium]